ncbi:MAG: hypothetical protein KAS72_14140 [Phycisphaerales bacterium]|nr:hypothetical protein [Phycisphaerales bacterium]
MTSTVTQSEEFDWEHPFQMIDFVLDPPVMATGVMITGVVDGDGNEGFVTISELDAVRVSPPARSHR